MATTTQTKPAPQPAPVVTRAPQPAPATPAIAKPAQPLTMRLLRAKYPPASVITFVAPNPKRGASKAFYNAYVVGGTVEAYGTAIAKLGAAKGRLYADLVWDFNRGHIQLAAPAATPAPATPQG